MKSLVRRLARVLGTILGIGVVTMLLLEVALRLVPSVIPEEALRIFNADLRTRIAARRGLMSRLEIEPVARDDGGPPHRLWRFRPGATIDHNAMDDMGFCNGTPDARTGGATAPVITLGDSFTYCWFVTADSAWPSLLGSRLAVPVYSLGLPDMGIHEEVQLLKRFGLVKQPRVVVLVFYEGNDLSDAIKVQAYRATVGSPSDSGHGATEALRPSLQRRIFYTLMESPPARWSYSFNLAIAGVGLGAQRLTEKRATSGENFRYRITLHGQSIDMNSRNSNADDLATARALAAGRAGIGMFSDALVEFLGLGARAGFTPVVAYMPSAHTIYRAEVTFDDPSAGPPLDAMHAALNGYWHRMADSLGFRFIDLTPTLQRAARSQAGDTLLNKPNDLHLSTLGHRLVAEYLAVELRSLVGPGHSPVNH